MKTTISRDYSHQTDYQTPLKNLAASLGILINFGNQAESPATDPFTPLPRFKLVIRSEDDYDDYELELMAKADQWHIPYNKKDPNINSLENEVCYYEQLIRLSSNLNIAWDFNVYDPIGLEQAIEEKQEEEYSHDRALQSDYYLSRGV